MCRVKSGLIKYSCSRSRDVHWQDRPNVRLVHGVCSETLCDMALFDVYSSSYAFRTLSNLIEVPAYYDISFARGPFGRKLTHSPVELAMVLSVRMSDMDSHHCCFVPQPDIQSQIT